MTIKFNNANASWNNADAVWNNILVQQLLKFVRGYVIKSAITETGDFRFEINVNAQNFTGDPIEAESILKGMFAGNRKNAEVYRFFRDESLYTNLIKYSNQQSGWGGTATRTPNFAEDPFGRNEAVRVEFGNSNWTDVDVLPNTQYTVSWWTKYLSSENPSFSVFDRTNSTNIIPSTQYTAGINWKRNTQTFTTPVGCALIRFFIERDTVGDVDFLFSEAQLELGSIANNNIFTNGTALSRNISYFNSALDWNLRAQIHVPRTEFENDDEIFHLIYNNTIDHNKPIDPAYPLDPASAAAVNPGDGFWDWFEFAHPNYQVFIL
jgi:hypothetical protein